MPFCAKRASQNTWFNVGRQMIRWRFNCYRNGCSLSLSNWKQSGHKGAKVILFDSRIPSRQKHAFSWPLFHVKPVFLITTRCYVLNESPFSRRHSLLRSYCCWYRFDSHTPRLTSVLRAIIGQSRLPISADQRINVKKLTLWYSPVTDPLMLLNLFLYGCAYFALRICTLFRRRLRSCYAAKNENSSPSTITR